ncbi:hypothetical protein IAU60_004593 [Kwoniella sp. DSM 27419]
MSQVSGECCPPQSNSKPTAPKVPPPVSEKSDYEYKGTFGGVANYEKVYVTGPDDAKHALVVIYDIFGFWDTTIRIFMPDVFKGHPFSKDDDNDPEAKKKFFAGIAKLEDRLPEVVEFAKALKKDHGIDKVSILGYCWGGKLALLSMREGTPFCCGSIVHPAMIASEDGQELAVPLGFYPSADEPKDVVADIAKALENKPFAKKNDYHHHHGWAAARANLNDPENLKQYEDVYQRLADYFASVKC